MTPNGGPASIMNRNPLVAKAMANSFVGALLMLTLTACSQKPSASPPSDTATNPAAAPTATPAPRPEFLKLVGKWERPDGGYVLEIRSVDAAGNMEAGYFNPDPIRVSKALAIQDGVTTKVFIELRDVNYPGCTYSLTYDPQTDQLHGQYFQAAVEQTYDIAFARLK